MTSYKSNKNNNTVALVVNVPANENYYFCLKRYSTGYYLWGTNSSNLQNETVKINTVRVGNANNVNNVSLNGTSFKANSNETATINTNGNERLRITNAGKVGIGVTEPNTTLEVLSTSTQQKWSYDADSFSTMAVDAGSNATLATTESGNITLDSAGNINLDAGGNEIMIKTAGNDRLHMFNSNGIFYIQPKTSSQPLIFRTPSGNESLRLDSNSNVGIGGVAPGTNKLYVKHSATDGAGGIYVDNFGYGKGYGIILNDTISETLNQPGAILIDFRRSGTSIGNISYGSSNNVSYNNFTGQHRTYYNDFSINTIKNMEGLIVSANKNSYTSMSGSLTKGLSAITVNESLPDITLCSKEKDKAVFGVISTTEDPDKREESYGMYNTIFDKETGDTRPYINSVGEGAIWVSNKNGDLESGDYITSSSIPGYGMKQDEFMLCNFTVAKITMDCNFSPQTVPKKIILKDSNGDNILDSNGYVQFVDHASETELQYNIRFLKDDGTIINESEYNTRLGNGESVYKAAFVGCTYHCG